MAAKFRKKPVVIEAIQWDGTYERAVEIGRFGADFDSGPTSTHQELYIKTLEGTMRADLGDFIIRGVQGEFYPCKPDIFEQSYEPA